MAPEVSTDTRQAIIDAALACFREHGPKKTTIVDIGRAAGVSRSTIYEYFPDKTAIIDACGEYGSQLFYGQLAKAMARGATIEDQLTRAAVFVVRARRKISSEKHFDADAVDMLLTRVGAGRLQESAAFVALYLNAAKLTGEVRKDLDVDAAGEWLARMLFSLYTTPSARLNTDDAAAIAAFVRPFVLGGFR